MTALIAWQFPDGSIAYTTPAPKERRSGEDDATFHARVAARLVEAVPSFATATRLADIDSTALPSAKFGIEYWRVIGGQIRVSFALAKNALVNDLRKKRDAIMIESDKIKAKYDDIGTAGEKTQVFTYRQSLRDLPAIVQGELAALTTVAQLEAYVAPIPPLPAGISL